MTVESRLKQTKNGFKLVGRVTRIDKDGAWKEEVMTKGKMEGELYRALKFGVKTSDTNEITVQMFDFEPKEVFLWHGETAKKAKEEGKEYKGEKIAYGKWENEQEELREGGYSILQTRIGVEYKKDENGKEKLDSHGLPSFVASEKIYENISNGDYVAIEGTIRYSTYKNQNDKVVEQKTYTITKLHKIKEVDFDGADFEEVTYFEQEMVFVGADHDKKEGKVYVTGRHINYNKTFHDTQMVINYKNADGTRDEDMVTLAEAFSKTVKFGDLLKVYGDTLNRVIVSEVEEEEKDKKDPLALFGGKSKPKHAQSYTSRTYVTEMSIHGVEKWEKSYYNEEDFVVDNLIEEKEKKNPFADELGGKAKKKNPFEVDEDEDLQDEELPF